MSDQPVTHVPLKARFPCIHGKWFRHSTDTRSPGPFKWCDGGTTRMLVGPTTIKPAWITADDTIWVEIEVTNE